MEFISLAVIGILIVISPGADFVLVLQNSMSYGRRAGVSTALGISIAIGVHIAYSLLGIGYLISQNTWLFHCVRYVGAAYLIYLGLKGVLGKPSIQTPVAGTPQESTVWRCLCEGFFCNVLNPKTMLFFFSVFSQVLAMDNASHNLALTYGIYMMLLHGLWFVLVATLLTSNTLQAWLHRVKHRLNQLCGAGLVLFGIVLGVSSTNPE